MGLNLGGAFGDSFLGILANVGTLGAGSYAQIGGVGNADGSTPAPNSGSAGLSQFGPSPYSSALSDSISKMPGFTPISAPSSNYKQDSYQAKDMSQATLPQYDAMRRRLDTQYSKTQSQAQDSLDRQFAAAGGGPGNGAQAKQTENLASSIASQKGNDLEGINAEEAQARTGLQQQEAQKEFQSQEAQKGYGFQANQADLGRQQSANQFNQQMQQQQNQFGFNAGATIANLNTSWDQAQAEYNNNEFNKQLAQWQQKHSGGLLGAGGLLGTGLFS